ncbi:hypothetical protein [Haladaptatus sp. CMAA 1911]|uniref:hypothetical protein n=1 Tax=unclassified Haladaptatus TaxID=2622732 RepID=UPI003754FE27
MIPRSPSGYPIETRFRGRRRHGDYRFSRAMALAGVEPEAKRPSSVRATHSWRET